MEMFSSLRGDIELLSLASYFAQSTELLAQEDQPDPQLLSLILYAIKGLCDGRPKELVKAAYELQLAVLAGYEPDLSGCTVCGSEEPEYFNISKGVFQCAACRSSVQDGLLMPASRGTRDAMRHIVECDIRKLFSFTLGSHSVRELSDIAESYLLTRLERGFYTLDFYKSLLLT